MYTNRKEKSSAIKTDLFPVWLKNLNITGQMSVQQLRYQKLLLSQLNINFQNGPPLHYFITDRSGRSAVVEFVNRKISVLRNTHSWQVATNFIITGLSPENSLAACWRYKKVWETLENKTALRSPLNALSLLKDVSQGNTIWSVVYDTSSLDFLVAMGKKYDQVYKFNLKKALSDQ